MMGSINPYSGLGLSTLDATKATNKTTLGQDEFLKLMTTQMTHQDPTKPMQNGEFLSQMAQFGTVSGIQGLQQSFKDFSASISSDQALQAASLVGRNVSVPSDYGLLPAGGEINGSFDLSASASTVNVLITDPQTGDVVRKINLDQQSAGSVPFKWDGFNDAGALASPGLYKVQAQASIEGVNTVFQPAIDSRVESVSMSNGSSGVQVNLAGLGATGFNKIKQIL
ncbi:MAG: flagellar hook assembly protein FlgD [Methylovulum sp.]|nr:flagellar hook assembly protein FlgD [Methylovulum sp.]